MSAAMNQDKDYSFDNETGGRARLRRAMAAIAGVALMMLPAVAMADGEARTQLTMPKGEAFARALLEINLSDGAAFEPVSVAPDLWYGLSDDLSLGLNHSSYGATGFMGGVGSGVCITGESGGCANVYDGFGIVGRYHLKSGAMTLAADGGLFVNSFDPFQLGIKAGVVGRWSKGKLAVVFNPGLYIGFTERDSGNKETLFVPASVQYWAGKKVSVGLQSGIVLPFSATGDTWAMPLSLGVGYVVKDRVRVLGAFGLPALAGGDLVPTGFDNRSLTLGVELGI